MLEPGVRKALNFVCCPCVKPNVPGQALVDNNEFVSRPTFVGPSILFWGKRQSQFPYQCFVGPDWPFMIIVYGLIIFINIVALQAVSPLGAGVVVTGIIGALLLLWYYSATVGSNPGIIFKEPVITADEESHPLHIASAASNYSPDSTDSSFCASMTSVDPINPAPAPKPDTILCGTCELQRPLTARHCHFCEACVNDLDHHCPWSGKCIGSENLKNFHCFIGWLSFQCLYLLVTFVYFVVHRNDYQDPSDD